VTAGLSFAAWQIAGFQAVDVADAVLETDRVVAVERTDYGISFRSRGSQQGSGILFLPGGMVDPIAYAPLLRKVASEGYPAHLLQLPMRCACTDGQVRELFQNIRRVMQAEPEMRWVVAGHSRGGMLASRFVHESGKGVAGLVLIGTTHPRDFSLAGLTIPAMKIYGTADGVASYSKMNENRHLLPQKTEWVEIRGGNHVQFGYYRHQLGDEDAGISRAEQQQLLAAAVLKALGRW